MKSLLLSCFLCLLFVTCKKEDVTPDPVEPTTLSLSISEVTPGDFVEIRVNKKVTQNEVDITLNSSNAKGYRTGDSSYGFIVPVVGPGVASLKISGLTTSNNLNLTIKSYTPISNPQTVIDDYVDKRNRSIDSIITIKPPFNFETSKETITLLQQIKEEWSLQMANLPAGHKEILAYVLQKNQLDPSAYSFSDLPASYYAREGRIQRDVGDRLVTIAKVYVTAHVICVASIPLTLGSGYSFLYAPNPYSALAFLAFFTTFVISKEVAVRKAEEVGRLKGVAEKIVEFLFQRTQATEFTNNSEKPLSMQVGFRNLKIEDAGINGDISSAFTAEQALIGKDKEVESLYSKISGFFSKLKGAYPSYVAAIGKKPQATMTLPVDGNNIIIKSVSDNRISYSTTVSGTTRKVKITSTATTEFNFNMQVAYKRALDGMEFTKDIPCVFNPKDSVEYYKALAVGQWTQQAIETVPGSNFGKVYQTGIYRLDPGGTGRLTYACVGYTCTPYTDQILNHPGYDITWSITKHPTMGYQIRWSTSSGNWFGSGRITPALNYSHKMLNWKMVETKN